MLKRGTWVLTTKDGKKVKGQIQAHDKQRTQYRVKVDDEVFVVSKTEVKALKKLKNMQPKVEEFLNTLDSPTRFDMLCELMYNNRPKPVKSGEVVQALFSGVLDYGVLVGSNKEYAFIWRIGTSPLKYFQVPWNHFSPVGEQVQVKLKRQPHIVSDFVASNLRSKYKRKVRDGKYSDKIIAKSTV